MAPASASSAKSAWDDQEAAETDTFGWRLLIGAILIAGGYAAWLLIPFAMSSDISPHAKTMLTACLGAMPLLTKLLAIALLGRPTINYLKKNLGKVITRASSSAGQ